MTQPARVKKLRDWVLSTYRLVGHRVSGYRLTRLGPVATLRKAVEGYLGRDLQPGVFFVNGKWMYLSVGELGLALTGFTEPYVTDYIRSTVRPGMIALDVGAHIGYYTVMLADLVGSSGRVFAFEPEGRNRAILERNLALNDLCNVTVVGKAVAARSGTLHLYLAPGNTGGHTAYPAPGHERMIETEAVTIDECLEAFGIRRVDFAKIDIEGFEYSALVGMEKIIANSQGLRIVLEYSPMMLERAGATPGAPLEFLVHRGFGLFEIGRSIKPATLKGLAAKYKRGNMNAMVLCEREA